MDLVIGNARIFDGEQFLSVRALGINNGRIAYLGEDAPDSQQYIDAQGRIVAPAFVDTHSHADFQVAHCDNDGASSLVQGVGTIVTGNCGMSSTPESIDFPLLFPNPGEHNASLQKHLEQIESGLSINVGELLGHNTLRLHVMGQPRSATRSDIVSMQSVLAEFLQAGWLGLSVGLNYPEAQRYSVEELESLAQVLSQYDRPLTCHIKDQGAHILEAMDEVLEVSERAGNRVLISHLRPLSTKPGHLVSEIEARFERFPQACFDVYPYVSGCTYLGLIFDILFHSEVTESNQLPFSEVEDSVAAFSILGFQDLHIIAHSNEAYRNQTIADLARELGVRPGKMVQEIYLQDRECICLFNNTTAPETLDQLIRHPRCMLGSDGWLHDTTFEGACHPRAYAAFTRFLCRYVRDGHVPIEAGLKKITSQPADFFGLEAGHIEVGARADVVLFSLAELKENADFSVPNKLSGGLSGLWLSGKPVVLDGSVAPASRSGVRLVSRSD